MEGERTDLVLKYGHFDLREGLEPHIISSLVEDKLADLTYRMNKWREMAVYLSVAALWSGVEAHQSASQMMGDLWHDLGLVAIGASCISGFVSSSIERKIEGYTKRYERCPWMTAYIILDDLRSQYLSNANYTRNERQR